MMVLDKLPEVILDEIVICQMDPSTGHQYSVHGKLILKPEYALARLVDPLVRPIDVILMDILFSFIILLFVIFIVWLIKPYYREKSVCEDEEYEDEEYEDEEYNNHKDDGGHPDILLQQHALIQSQLHHIANTINHPHCNHYHKRLFR